MNVGSLDKPVYLPAELCEIPPGQIFGGKQSREMSQGMIKFSCRRPPQNYASIMKEGMEILGLNDEITKFGIRVTKAMTIVPARILSPPSLVYAKKTTKTQFGSWNLQRTRFSEGATVKNWTCLTLRKAKQPLPNVDGEMNMLYKKLREHGLNLPPPSRPFLTLDLDFSSKVNREKLRKEFKGWKENNYSLLVVILPDNGTELFDWIKYIGDLKIGILTHCMLVDKFRKTGGQEQYMSNNAMKINLKMGGRNQLLDSSGLKFIGQGKTMVMGYDVTHPAPGLAQTEKSIAGIVASIDGQMAQWPGEVLSQEAGKEEVAELVKLVQGRLDRWIRENKEPPANILVYRDGVSEGQYMMVLNMELPRIRRAAADIANYRPEYKKFAKYKPKITVIISGKRHHVRFYPTKAADGDRTSNPPSGSVVDRVITRPLFWDFYLQAQSPLQGSARPCHYIVIHDEIFSDPKISPGKPADVVQELTHNICYMMGRATRSISYATPAFLADRYCERARKYVAAVKAMREGGDKVWDDAELGSNRKSSNAFAIHSDFPLSMVYI